MQNIFSKSDRLLDTNIVSEFTKPDPNAGCAAWVKANSLECGLSAITVGELRYGIERLAEGKRRNVLTQAFEFLLQDYNGRFFDFDGFACVEWGRYAAELEGVYGQEWWRTFDLRDTMHAAIAREYGLAVVTRNTKHFPLVTSVNPFSA